MMDPVRTRSIAVFVVMVIFALLWAFGALPAHAQLQGGPNISPSGIPFTFSPRFGYLGPPAFFVPPPPPRPRYYVPGNAVVIPIPRQGPAAPPLAVVPPAGPPPASPYQPPATRGYRDPKSPALRAPKGSRQPPPCPDGCQRGPDDTPPANPTGFDI